MSIHDSFVLKKLNKHQICFFETVNNQFKIDINNKYEAE